MKINFDNLKDFVEELDKDKDNIERGIVRVNTETAALKYSPNIHAVSVRAECIVAGHILSYREYCGDIWGHGGQPDEKTKTKERELRGTLDAELVRLGITDIRGGTIEEAEAKA